MAGNEKKALPSCIACTYDDRGYPCRRPDGTLDCDKIAAGVVARGRLFGGEHRPDDEALASTDWASDCEFEIERNCPHLLIAYLVAAMDACETARDAAFISAGPVENAVIYHGPRLIAQLEELAAASAKVRYFLSAIWGEGRADPDVWKRVANAIGSGGRMDADGRTPWNGEPVTVLDEEAARRLLREPVTPLARRLGLIA